MIVVGIDFGDARTGFASCDPDEILASPQGMIKITGMDDAVAKSAIKLKELGAQYIVVGCPVNMDGTKGHRADRCTRYAEMLSAATGLPFEMMDERLTTVEAYTYMNISDTKSRKRRGLIDTLSAQIILQSWLDMKKNKK